jgi:prevent-host-death family protein
MGSINSTQARDRLAEVIDRAAYGQERIILTRRGKALAAIVRVEDVEWLE